MPHFMKIAGAMITCVLLFCSCQQRIYFPDRVNSPGFTEQGQLKTVVAFTPHATNNNAGTRGYGAASPSFDAAYAISDHIGVMASYRSLLNKGITEDTLMSGIYTGRRQVMGGYFNVHRWEAGAGYYGRLGGKGKAELYAGFGAGSVQRRGELLPQYDFNTKFYRIFLQPAMGIELSRRVTFSVMAGFRMALQQYYDFSSANADMRYIVTNANIDGPAGGKDVMSGPFYMVEPFADISVGSRGIRFNLQVGMGVPATNSTSSNRFMAGGSYLSLGAMFMLHTAAQQKGE